MPQSETLSPPLSSNIAQVEISTLQKPATLQTQSLEDARLTERITLALRATGYGALFSIKVSVDVQVVRLVGRVPSYYMKQVALATALAVPGTHRVLNELDVAET
jgi:osmotically-inducible protein OsmY